MRCPKCTSIEDKVIDSRIARDGNNTRRRRECLECGHRFTPSLYVPGCPPHPLTFISGILDLLGIDS